MLVLHRRQVVIDLQPEFLVGHILTGQEVLDRKVQRQPGRHLDRRSGFLRFDRLSQHRVVELEPHRRNRAVLFGAKQIARAPDLEILQRQLEPRSQVMQL